jgi:hypothetical protein
MRLRDGSIRNDYPVRKTCFWQGYRVDLRMFIAQPQRAAPAPGHGPGRQFPQFQLKMQESILDKIRDGVQSPLHSDWPFHDKVLFCMQVGCTAKTPRGAETNDWRWLRHPWWTAVGRAIEAEKKAAFNIRLPALPTGSICRVSVRDWASRPAGCFLGAGGGRREV